MDQSDQQRIREAAQWLARLENSDSPAQVMVEIDRWRLLSPQHRRAWELAAQLSEGLKVLPTLPADSFDSLEGACRSRSRRRAMRTLMLGGVSVAAATLVATRMPLSSWTAQYQTASGENREVKLADEGEVVLNTASALDIDEGRRNLWLRSGEILVAHESVRSSVPLVVHTRDGEVSLFGGRTGIEVQASATRVAALKGEVTLRFGGNATSLIVPEGSAGRFDAAGSLALLPISLNDEVWTKGLIYADQTPLPDFINQLARYSRGVIRCNPALANLKVSGLYNYSDINGILQFIAKNYPVSTRSITPLWISIDRA